MSAKRKSEPLQPDEDTQPKKAKTCTSLPAECQKLIEVLGPTCKITLLSEDQKSWVAYAPKFSTHTKEDFGCLWAQHPKEPNLIRMMGKWIRTPRFTQAYGRPYSFSGQTSPSIPFDSSEQVKQVLTKVNQVVAHVPNLQPFNMALVNWYEPDHYIGPHSDDERQLVPNMPIFSVTWGETRTFRLTARPNQKKQVVPNLSIDLNDGDLVIMGGHCQKTHKHEITRLPKSQHLCSTRRINFTFRCFK